MTRLLPIAILLAVSAALGGCADENADVTIVYEQDSNFLGYKVDSTSTQPEDVVFIMYRIVSISNTDANAKPFTFDRMKASVALDGFQQNHPTHELQLLDNDLIQHVDVAPGEVEKDREDLGCFIMMVATSEAASFSSKQADLAYEGILDPSQTIHMVREAKETVAVFTDYATPDVLQNRCQGGYI